MHMRIVYPAIALCLLPALCPFLFLNEAGTNKVRLDLSGVPYGNRCYMGKEKTVQLD